MQKDTLTTRITDSNNNAYTSVFHKPTNASENDTSHVEENLKQCFADLITKYTAYVNAYNSKWSNLQFLESECGQELARTVAYINSPAVNKTPLFFQTLTSIEAITLVLMTHKSIAALSSTQRNRITQELNLHPNFLKCINDSGSAYYLRNDIQAALTFIMHYDHTHQENSSSKAEHNSNICAVNHETTNQHSYSSAELVNTSFLKPEFSRHHSFLIGKPTAQAPDIEDNLNSKTLSNN